MAHSQDHPPSRKGSLPWQKTPGKKTDIIIALMGPTGIGKSTFINVAVGRDVAVVGHRLQSCTTDVQPYTVAHPQDKNLNVVFVDTPGFNDTNLDDSDILELIAAWLKNSYEKGTKLSGIIYLHEISQAHMFGTSRKSLQMFGKLCGDTAVQNVTLATTKWSKVSSDEGAGRERELRETYWRQMLALGSNMVRFTDTADSAWGMVDPIVKKRKRYPLLIQEELVTLERTLPETEAGKALRITLQDLAQKLKDGEGTEQAEKLVRQQVQKLKVPLSRRLSIFLSNKKTSSRPLEIMSTGTVEKRMEHDDIVILILGLTGAGKSTFINTAATRPATEVGHGLNSCTAAVRSVFVTRPNPLNRRVVFVDTPGFNDTKKDDVHILQLIIDWLKPLEREGIMLSGVVYVHDITQTSIVPSSDSLAMLRSFSSEVINHAVLATTCWSKTLGDEGDRREEDLCEEYWTELLARGASKGRFMATHESAWDLVKLIPTNPKVSPGLLRTELESFRNRLKDRPGRTGLLSLLRVTLLKGLLGRG